MREFDLASRGKPHADRLAAIGAKKLFNELDDQQIIQLMDWVIYNSATSGYRSKSEGLETILRSGGSRWKVGLRLGIPGLEERVSQGVQDAAESVVARSGQAGVLLSEEWHAAFGVNPNPEEAYEKAIKAVEEAGASVVAPKSSKGTLGTMVRDMKAQKDWRLDLPTPDADAPVKMAEALWVGQESRHGGNGYRKPTQAEAEAAVLLAVPLVQWFSSGGLTRRSSS
jgi:hypothetical protein